MKKLLTAAVLAVYSSSAFAHGDEHYKPNIEGFGAYGDINLIGAYNYDSDQISEEYNELSTHSHASAYYNFGEGTSINTKVELAHEHTHHHGSATPTDDKFFQEHALMLKELYLEHKFGKMDVYGGKISPAFAFDYDDYPIVWGQEAAEEYAMEDKIGFGASYDVTENQKISLSTFFADTSFMSDSLFFNEEHNNDEDESGAGNTEAFNNFALNYKIKLPELNGALLNFGYAFQKQGEADEADENRVTAGLKKNFVFNEALNLDVITEWVNEMNAEGRAGRRLTYDNIGGRLNYDKAFFAANITDKHSNEEHPRKQFYNFAVGYEVLKDVEASVGWERTSETSTTSDAAVLMLSYKFDICPCE